MSPLLADACSGAVFVRRCLFLYVVRPVPVDGPAVFFDPFPASFLAVSKSFFAESPSSLLVLSFLVAALALLLLL